jgi:hypothetical protein
LILSYLDGMFRWAAWVRRCCYGLGRSSQHGRVQPGGPKLVLHRLHGRHLKETLPRDIAWNAEHPNLEFVLLNCNSRDDMAIWVKVLRGARIEPIEQSLRPLVRWRDFYRNDPESVFLS